MDIRKVTPVFEWIFNSNIKNLYITCEPGRYKQRRAYRAHEMFDLFISCK